MEVGRSETVTEIAQKQKDLALKAERMPRELHYEYLKPQEIKRLVESRDAVKVARPVR